MKNSHLIIQLTMVGLLACVLLIFSEKVHANKVEEAQHDSLVDGPSSIVEKRYRLMSPGKRYRLAGKRYRLAGKRAENDADEDSELMKLFDSQTSPSQQHSASKRYRLMGKRYRLFRHQRMQPRHFELPVGEASKRYRLAGKRHQPEESSYDEDSDAANNDANENGEEKVLFDDEENSDDNNSIASAENHLSENDLLRLFTPEKRYRLAGKRYRLAGKRYRLAG
jgi:hypothetical protein